MALRTALESDIVVSLNPESIAKMALVEEMRLLNSKVDRIFSQIPKIYLFAQKTFEELGEISHKMNAICGFLEDWREHYLWGFRENDRLKTLLDRMEKTLKKKKPKKKRGKR